MVTIQDFTDQTVLIARKWGHKHYASIAAELNAIATALNTDTSKHDLTITKPPAAVKPGHNQTYFTNDILVAVNRGKGGGLTPLAMSNAITAELSKIFPPVMTSPPVVSGTATVGSTLSCTNGNWTYVPTGYGYVWLRGGVPITGATASTHVLVAADSGNNIACRVGATNAAGTTYATSNAVAVTGLQVLAKGGGPLPPRGPL
jgi:hypothetical protein